MPGLVSTLLNHAYSIPGRLVQTFLQVTLQVWQPMHLSRFSTIPICARTFIFRLLRGRRGYGFSPCDWYAFARWSSRGVSNQSTFFILRTTTNSSRLVPIVP